MDITQNNSDRQYNSTQRYEVLQQLGDCYASVGNCTEVNQQRPTVDTLLLEALLCRGKKKFTPAIELLKNAEHILEGNELLWT
jgi:hypothetical protein